MADDDELRSVIAGIEATFGVDVDGWLVWFDEPFVMVGPEGAMVLPDHGVARERFAAMFEQLRAVGFASTTADDVRVRLLGGGLALVDARFTRRRADGSVLEQLAALYTCRRAEAGWRVVSLLRHPVEIEAL